MKKITMQNIADKLNISKVTVHRAFTNNGEISPSLKEKILKEAEAMGFNYRSKNVINKKNFLFLAKRIYFLNEEEHFYSTIYKELNKLCEQNGAKLTLMLYETIEDKVAVKNMVCSGETFGIFVAGQFSNQDMGIFETMPIPVIVIDAHSPLFNLNYVYLNSYNDAYALTCYAIQRGHTKIGYLGQLKETSSLSDRFFGFRKALIEYNLPFNREWIWTKKVDNMLTFHTVMPKNLPTLIICHCDLTASHLINFLKIQNYKVPKDISILSFDDTETALKSTPTISSMGIEKIKFATTALELMKKKIIFKSDPESIMLKSVIQERDSFNSLEKINESIKYKT